MYKYIKEHVFEIVLIILFTFAFAFMGWYFSDPDYWWRIKTGEYILQNGIPKIDLYTYTMSSFPWVDHAWPQDVIFFTTREFFGEFWQSFLWAIVASASLLVSSILFNKTLDIKLFSDPKKDKKFTFFKNTSGILFISSFLIFLDFFGVRVQVLTWLIFAVFLTFLLDQKRWVKYRKFMPAYFLLWANFHGGFASGLAAFLLYIALRSIRKRKIDYIDFVIFLCSTLITLVNPYGPELWREVWSSITDSQLKWRIKEWQPIFFGPQWPTAFLMGLTGVFMWIYRKKYKLEDIGVFSAFLLQAILSIRHIPLWTLLAIPIGSKSIYYLYKESLTYKFGKKRFVTLYKILWVIVALLFTAEISYTAYTASRLQRDSYYPVQAVDYLKESDYQGRLFSVYGWGGYLIWNYTDSKLFIDGRMPSWRWEANIEGETNAAVDDYFGMLEGEVNVQEQMNKYGVDIVLWRNEEEKRTLWTVLESKLGGVFSKEDEDVKSIPQQLLENDWEKVYQDSKASIYIR